MQHVTEETAEQVISSLTHVCHGITQHSSRCSLLQYAPGAVASALQLLESEHGVYYAVDGLEPSMPIAFTYSQVMLCL